MQITELSLIRQLAKEDFYFFCQEFWSEISKETPVWNWHIPLLCEELQMAAERVFVGDTRLYDLIINIPPGTTKSTIVSIMFPAWIWTRMPHAQIICGSYVDDLSTKLSMKCRDIIRSEKYQKCFPEVRIRRDQDTKHQYDTTAGGSRYAATVGGNITGFHAHFILVDDPINPKGARSDADITAVNNWMNETLPSRKVNKDVTLTVLVMQRLNQNDPTGNALDKQRDDVHHICLPAEVSEHVRPKRLKRYYKGGLLDPIRLSKKILLVQEKELGAFGYAGQYGQHPIPIGGATFDVGMLRERVGPPPGPWSRPSKTWVKLMRYWDKAGTHKGGCFTVGVLMGVDNMDRYWVLNVIRGQWASGERERIIYNTAIADGRHVVVGVEEEGGSGGKESAEGTTTRLAGFRVLRDRPDTDKTTRADEFSVQVNVGNVYIAPGAWNPEYFTEMAYFPNSTYKDQVDASSGAAKYVFKKPKRAGGVSGKGAAGDKGKLRGFASFNG